MAEELVRLAEGVVRLVEGVVRLAGEAAKCLVLVEAEVSRLAEAPMALKRDCPPKRF